MEPSKPSYRWNPDLHDYELALDPQAILSFAETQTRARSYHAPLTNTKTLFIGPKYEDEPQWRASALKI